VVRAAELVASVGPWNRLAERQAQAMPSDHGRADALSLGRYFSDSLAAFLSEEEVKLNDMAIDIRTSPGVLKPFSVVSTVT
jgi:hypothetical protein